MSEATDESPSPSPTTPEYPPHPELCLRDDNLIVHCVGPQLTFANRSRQRCIWCGIIVEDKFWPEIAVPVPEGKTPDQAVGEAVNGAWEMGMWIVIDAEGLRYATEFDGMNPPPGACVWWPVDETPTDAHR